MTHISPDHDRPHPPGGTWTVLAITMAIQALATMSVLTIPSMAPALSAALRLPTSLLGVYIAVVYVAAMLTSMAAGPLVLRYGAMRVSQLGLLGCAAGLALLASATSVPAALAAAVLIGLGYGPITPASSHVLVRTAPPNRVSLIFSLKQTGVPLGGVMAGALVPPIVVGAGLHAALWTVGLACLACCVLAEAIRRVLDADRRPGHPISLGGLLQPLKLVVGHAHLRPLAASSFVFSAMQMCLATYLVAYLNADLGLSLVAAGAALSVSQVGGVVGRVVWGWVCDHWIAPMRMLALLAVMMTLCAVATALVRAGVAQGVLLTLLAAFGACAAGWNGVYLGEVARRAPPGSAGAATGGSLAVTFMGVVTGPMLFGLLAGAGAGFRGAYLAMAAATLACAAVLAARSPRPGWQES